MKALILAGGFGTRLRPLTEHLPKCLLPINNIALIEYQLEQLRSCSEIILATNYLEDRIRKYLEFTGNDNVVINHEEKPLGTAGAILNARDILGNRFLVMNGDVISDCDVEALISIGDMHSSNVIMTNLVPDPSRFGSISIDKGKIRKFSEKAENNDMGWINGGIYYLNDTVFDYIPKGRPSSIELDVFPRLASSGTLYAHKHRGVWHDIGTLESYIDTNLNLSGKDVVIGSNCVIKNSDVRRSVILDNAVIEDSSVFNSVIGYKGSVKGQTINGQIVC